jgi:hypothetical protein
MHLSVTTPQFRIIMADADGPLDERGVLLEEKAYEGFSCPLFVGMQTLGAGQGNQAHHLGKIKPCPLMIKA